jgi:hypothetical protein
VRWLSLLVLLLLSGCYYPYGYYPYGYYPYGYYGYAYPYGAQPLYYGTPSYDGSQAYSSGQPAAVDPNNCGTPDEPKSCYGVHR